MRHRKLRWLAAAAVVASRGLFVQEYMYVGLRMKVPFYGRASMVGRGAVVAMVAACFGAVSAAAGGPKTPQPVAKIELAKVGFPGFSQSLVDVGASMLSVHFVDDEHLLVTYSLRGLVERSAEDQPDDNVRAVGGVLVDLRSGKVMARTRWHMHDYAQYLWPLGRGRFLVRTRSTLKVIAPMQNLASGEAFRETPFLSFAGRKVDLVQVAPEGDLVTVQTSLIPRKAEPKPPGAVTFSGVAEAPVAPPETVTFVRVVGNGSAEDRVVAVGAGSTVARGMGLIPLNERGYLYATDKRRGDWEVAFEGFDGDVVKLAPILSSCAPRMQFVSLTQFVAFTCRGSTDSLMLSAFDFLPRETWEEPFSGTDANPYFAIAPKTGRFAYSRTVAASTAGSDPTFAPGGVAPAVAPTTFAQEVRVYQTESGDLLLKLAATPMLRAGQNFDLSPDGMSALVVRAGFVEVYRLPELSKADRKELAEVQAKEPRVVTAERVVLRRLMKQAVGAEEPASERAAGPAVLPADTAAVPAKAVVNGDEPVAPGRKAPSLLGPGETVPKQ